MTLGGERDSQNGQIRARLSHNTRDTTNRVNHFMIITIICYDKNGEHKTSNYSNHDNLIIKGNNLIALHSLKERYAGKINLIYLDPPYNTGTDSFAYNDRFNQSESVKYLV